MQKFVALPSRKRDLDVMADKGKSEIPPTTPSNDHQSDSDRRDDQGGSDDDDGYGHEDMYAGVSNLFAACEATNATRPKRHRTEEEKREERLAANRRSARESRNRKKLVFEELQRSVARLAEENAALRKENDTIRGQMNSLKRQFGLLPDAGPDRNGQGPSAQGGHQQPQQYQQQQALGGGDHSGGLDFMQQQQAQGDNQGTGGVSFDQAHQQLAMIEAAQQQQQLQLAAAAGLGPFGPANLLGAGQPGGTGDSGQGLSGPNDPGPQGAAGQDADYQNRLQQFQRRVEERSQLINQLKNSLSRGGAAASAQHPPMGNSVASAGGPINAEALRLQLLQLQQQGQGNDEAQMGGMGSFMS